MPWVIQRQVLWTSMCKASLNSPDKSLWNICGILWIQKKLNFFSFFVNLSFFFGHLHMLLLLRPRKKTARFFFLSFLPTRFPPNFKGPVDHSLTNVGELFFTGGYTNTSWFNKWWSLLLLSFLLSKVELFPRSCGLLLATAIDSSFQLVGVKSLWAEGWYTIDDRLPPCGLHSDDHWEYLASCLWI